MVQQQASEMTASEFSKYQILYSSYKVQNSLWSTYVSVLLGFTAFAASDFFPHADASSIIAIVLAFAAFAAFNCGSILRNIVIANKFYDLLESPIAFSRKSISYQLTVHLVFDSAMLAWILYNGRSGFEFLTKLL